MLANATRMPIDVQCIVLAVVLLMSFCHAACVILGSGFHGCCSGPHSGRDIFVEFCSVSVLFSARGSVPVSLSCSALHVVLFEMCGRQFL